MHSPGKKLEGKDGSVSPDQVGQGLDVRQASKKAAVVIHGILMVI